MLTIAADEVVYKLGPEAEAADIGMEDSNTRGSGRASRLPHPKLPEPAFPHLGLSGSPLQVNPRRAGRTPNAVLPDGAYHQGSKLGSGQLWTQKHPPQTGKEGASEGIKKL